MVNHVATYWEYTGNHHNGRDHIRDNPHGYPIALVSFIAWCDDFDTKIISKDSFGRTVQVKAPKQTWEDSWIILAEEEGDRLISDWGISRAEEYEGSLWAESAQGEYVCELFYIDPDETLLEQVQKGYGIMLLNGKSYLFKCSSIAKQ